MKTIFVNGGAGFIGHHICIELKKRNYNVFAIDKMQQLRFHKNKRFYQCFIDERLELLKKFDIKLIKMDTENTSKYLNLIEKYNPEIIYHMSAIASAKICKINPSKAFSENLANVEKILENIRTTNTGIRFVFASSSVSYGEFTDGFVTEETPLRPINMYGLTKKNSEELIRLYNRNYDITYTIIRPSALYGPRCVNRRVTQIMIENILEKKPVILYGGGNELLDFTFVDDTVQGFVKAGTSNNGINETFDITFGQARRVKDLIEILKKYFPNIEIKYEKRNNLMPKRGTLKIDKAKMMVGYEPTYSIETGYPIYIEWYLANKKKFKIGEK